MRSIFFRIFIFIFILVAADQLVAQDLNNVSPSNLKSLNVDELSDAQIGKLISQFEASGYSEQQIEILARARGASETQITKLRQRINEYRSGSGSSNNSNEIGRSRNALGSNNQSALNETDAPFDPFGSIYPVDSLELIDGLPIFGQSFFKNKSLTFEPSLNVATPKSYQLGSGDQLIIDVWGASEQNYQLTVSPEGSIVIPNIGPVYVNGLSMERAESRIKSRLKSIYSTLGRNTFAQISLGQIRTISINVIGEVVRPGSYEMSSFGTAFNALYLAGGPSKNGSLREIKIFRAGEFVGALDAYQFLVFGEGENFRLQDQDMVIVSPYLNRVIIDGEVKRPAVYETTNNESFEKAMQFAGGLTSKAYSKSISIRRNLENRKTVETITSNQFDSFILKDGDKIDVGAIQNQFIGRVTVEGAVNHPSEFALREGMKLSEAIELADGFRDDAFMLRAVIIRQNKDLSLSSMAFSPTELINRDSDETLQSEDLIKIQSVFDLQEEFKIAIQGEVQMPGDYPFVEGLTVEDLIYLSNGFKETAAKSFVEVARRVVEDSGEGFSAAQIFNFPIDRNLNLVESDSQFELKPFDLVVIRRSPFYEKQAVIEIEGEVTYPGKYALESKVERISDVLKRSGGLTKFAYAKGATLIRRTEYFDNGEDATSAAAKLRRTELEQILERDTLVNDDQNQFKSQELIGIQLNEIISSPGGKHDLILKEGDILSVPRELQTIRIRGEVLYPSTIRFEKGKRFKQFVSNAGGFTDNAKKSRIYVVNANGSAQRTKSFLWFRKFPKIEPGAEIIIPKRPERRKITPGEIIGITTGLGTIALIINNLTTK